MEIRRAVQSDIEAIVLTHISAFPGFFLTLLGKNFLFELYKGFLEEEKGILLVAESPDSDIAGFLAGAVEPENFFRDLRNKKFARFLYCAIPSLLMHPVMVAKKLLGAIFYKGENPGNVAKGALLSSIGVSPDYSGIGLGRALLEAFEREVFIDWKCPYIYLLTDKYDNNGVNLFYAKQDYFVSSEVCRSDRRIMNCFKKENSQY